MKIIKNYKDIENCILIDSENAGETISIFSGIHGDEVSGIKANKKILEKIINKEIKIKKGKVILVLEANKEAIKINKREKEFNMNRLFRDDIDLGKSYEEQRAKELMNILKEVDFHLDLHSTSGPSIPFLYSELTCFDLAKRLGISHIIAGWNDLGGVIAGDTENYVNNNGGKAFTFEAGNHDCPDGTRNSFQAILNFLSSLEFIDEKYFKKIGNLENNFMKISYYYKAKSNNFKYKIDIDNFSKLKKGELIGIDSGEKVISQKDMILVMPKTEDIIKKGIEVFFIGEEIKSI